MTGLARYVLSESLRGQRWFAPVLCFAVVDAVVGAQSGSVLPTFAILATALVFTGTWLTVVIVNNEDPVQLTITEVAAGGRTRVRLAKLCCSYGVVAVLGALGLVLPCLLARGGAATRDLVAGLAAQLIAALAGVALGALCSRPVVRHRAWAVLVGLVVGLATVLLPVGVPSRQLLVLFDRTGPVALAGPVGLIGLETLALCALAVVASWRVAIRRS